MGCGGGGDRVLLQLVQQLVSCRERCGWGKERKRERESVRVCVQNFDLQLQILQQQQ